MAGANLTTPSQTIGSRSRTNTASDTHRAFKMQIGSLPCTAIAGKHILRLAPPQLQLHVVSSPDRGSGHETSLHVGSGDETSLHVGSGDETESFRAYALCIVSSSSCMAQ